MIARSYSSAICTRSRSSARIFSSIENDEQETKTNHDFMIGLLAELLRRVVNAGDLGFDSLVGRIGHSVVNGSPPLRRFFAAEVLSRGDGPRHSLHAST